MKGLYIHIPFCLKKCNYCDFASYPSCISRSGEYILAVKNEMKQYKGERIDTVYFGGGTPTLLSAHELNSILDSVFSEFQLSPSAEITIEANPCTINKDKSSELKRMGFNRVSLGAQSFIDDELRLLGRKHSSIQTIEAYESLKSAGFNNISLDLMYALPNQTMESLSTSIGQLLKLKPQHISCYGLKIEEQTPFYGMLKKGEIKEKTDDEYADMYEVICDSLSYASYSQYELSNFSLPGFESKHNLKYWTNCEYIGIGLGASSYYKDKRYTHTTDFDKYLQNYENAEEFELLSDDKMSEYMFLSLRLTKRGAIKKEFESNFGVEINKAFPDAINKHLKTGMLLDLGDRYVLSPKAYYISNSVLCDFV